MAEYTIFDANSGAVLRTLSGTFSPELIAKQSRSPNEIIVEGRFDDGQFYMEGQDAIERPQLTVPDAEMIEGAFAWEITDVPDGTQFSWQLLGSEERGGGVVDNGSIEFATAFEGTYQFDITPPAPWKPTRERKEYRLEVQP